MAISFRGIKARNRKSRRELVDENFISYCHIKKKEKVKSTRPMDLMSSLPFPITERLMVGLYLRGMKNGRVTLRDSTNGKTRWRNIPSIRNPVISPKTNRRITVGLPQETRRFIKATVKRKRAFKSGELMMELYF